MAEESLTDADLVMRLRAGDAWAAEVIVDRYEDLIFAWMYRDCDNREQAEDLTQEILVKALTGVEELRDTGVFRQWLFRIAGNRLRDFVRQKKRQKAEAQSLSEDSEGCVAQRSARNDDPAVALELKEWAERNRVRIDAALGELRKEYRAVVVMFHLLELPQKEIAEILDVSEGTISVRLNRARERLRAIMRRDEREQH